MLSNATPYFGQEFRLAEHAGPAQPVPETRGILFELDPATQLEDVRGTLESLRERGYNLLVLKIFADGATYFRSRLMKDRGLPAIDSAFRDTPELLFQTADLAGELGFQIYAQASLLKLKSSLRSHSHTMLKAQPKWIARNKQGKPAGDAEGQFKYLCPANPELRMFLGDLLHEVLFGLPAAGILLSDLGFPPGTANAEQTACYCANCTALVDRELTKELASIALDPADPHYKRWAEWRAEKVGQLFRALSLRIRKTNPQLLIGVMAHNWRRDPDTVADGNLLDCPGWIGKRMIDALVPVYENLPLDKLAAQLELDLRQLPDSAILLPLLREISQADLPVAPEILRRFPACGMIFDQRVLLKARAGDCFPDFSSPGAGESFPVEAAPLRSAIVLLAQAAGELPQQHEIRLFLDDVVKLFEPIAAFKYNKKLLANVSVNLRGLIGKIGARQLVLPAGCSRVSRNLDLAQRLLELLQSKHFQAPELR